MEAKKAFMLIFGLTEDQAEQIITKAGKIGFAVPGMVEKFFNDVTEEESDDPERADLAKKWLQKLSSEHCMPSLLSFSFTLSGGDFREFIDCLLYLKQKQDEEESIETMLDQVEQYSFDDINENVLSELEKFCEEKNLEFDEGNRPDIKTWLEEEILKIRNEMYVPDLGFDPDNLYSAVDVMQKRFDEYCQTYEIQDADISEELEQVVEWLKETESQFRALE